MNDRFSPIAVGKVAPAPSHIPAPRLSIEAMYAAQDEMADYAVSLPRHIKPTDYDALVTRDELRETTLARMVNDHDQADAIEYLVLRGEIGKALADRIEEVSLEMAEKRLNRAEVSHG
jgi:hypothetical protein